MPNTSPARCIACVATTPQLVRFPRAAPASPPTHSSQAPEVLVPYPEATPGQRRQVLVVVRQILQAAYPALEEGQWDRALEKLPFPLYIAGKEVGLSCDGLAALGHYLAAHHPTLPVTDPYAFPVLLPDDQMKDPKKQTFNIPAGLALQLKRVSYWKRVSFAWLLNQALARLLGQFPEALVPTPDE